MSQLWLILRAALGGAFFEVEEVQRVAGCGTGVGPCTPPKHVHPTQTETFTVIEGRFAYEVEGTLGVIGVGESVVVPRNAVHTWWIEEGSTEDVRVRFRLEPAGSGEAFFENLAGVLHDTRGNPPALQMLALFCASTDTRLDMPSPVHNAICAVVSRAAPLLGLQATYPQYTYKE